MVEYNATWQEYCEAIESILRFYYIHNGVPEYICVPYKSPTECTNKFYQKDWEDAMKRVENYKKTNNDQKPPNVWFRTIGPTKTAYVLKFEESVGRTINTLTEGYNSIKGRVYAYYYNDIYNQTIALQRLKYMSGLNCTDICQLMYQLAKDIGYSVRYVNIKCSSGSGHIQLDVKGKEFGDTWKRIDPAAALKSSYEIGELWCATGYTLIGYDQSWLISDDGIT